MARRTYDPFFADLLARLLANDVRVAIIDTEVYTPDFADDQFLSNVPAAARLAISEPLENITVTDGVVDADDVVFNLVAPGVEDGDALLLFIDTGLEQTSSLVLFDDEAPGLPVTVTDGTVTVRWSDGVDRIFRVIPAPATP